MSEIDDLWSRATAGDREAFGDWMGRVERPIRRGLQRFAAAIDVESVVQETFLRMWLRASKSGEPLVGENASLRFAWVLAVNLARNMARKHHREVPDGGERNEPAAPVATPADPLLRQRILDCIGTLARKPREALMARLTRGASPDLELARGLKMAVNTFLQNIVRARRQMEDCLRSKGVFEHEALR
jgi:DNA-directed RNA polymerase specialized sigma24 family protein